MSPSPVQPYLQMDPADAAVIQALADHMLKVFESFRAVGRSEARWAVADPSPLVTERLLLRRQFGPQGTWTGDAAEYVGDAALLFLLAQADHLLVLHQLYRTHAALMFGLGPPARSLLEISGYVFWLLHPDVNSVRTRASRALLAQLNDATRERTAAKDLGAPPTILTERGEQLNDLKARVDAQFYASEVGRDKSGTLILRGEKHPGPGAVLQHLSVAGAENWNSRGAYSFLSNAAHPTLHVITDTIEVDSDGVPTRFGHSNAQYQYRIARMAMAGFLRTWQITAAYRGLDGAHARDLLEEIDALPEP